MGTAIPIADEAAAREAIVWALGERRTLEVRAQGTKRGLGRPPAADCVLDLSGFCGVVDYQPAELVLKARPATPLAEIEALTGGFHQRLAFEPPDYGPLYGGPPGRGTLGGALACNLSGPRRISAFAARDHFLGMRAVSGRGEAFKAGGSVVKNVTGYDLCKLLAGSYGTLAVLTEITVRVSPSAEKTRTVLIFGLDAARAIEALTAALASPFEVSGAAYLPASLARGSAVDYVRAAGAAVAALRLEGIAPSVLARTDALRELMAPFGAVEELHGKNSALLWREVRDGALLPLNAALWRVSLPPAQAPAFLAAIGADHPGAEGLLDWGGGLVWLALEEASEDAGATSVRRALAPLGGHALLVRAPEALRARVAVFEPLGEPVMALTCRLKEGFDPARCLNPGRMYPEV